MSAHLELLAAQSGGGVASSNSASAESASGSAGGRVSWHEAAGCSIAQAADAARGLAGLPARRRMVVGLPIGWARGHWGRRRG